MPQPSQPSTPRTKQPMEQLLENPFPAVLSTAIGFRFRAAKGRMVRSTRPILAPRPPSERNTECTADDH